MLLILELMINIYNTLYIFHMPLTIKGVKFNSHNNKKHS